jgi:hypothetical protein
MQESTTPSPRYGLSSRGVSGRDVELAADALLREGERPTIEKIREKIGRGSPNTINPLLDAWWKRLASRLDAGPAALHRLPESVAHVAEALWMQALEEGRRRAEHEIGRAARSAAQGQSDLEVRSHVLSLREGELESRLKDRERTLAALESQLQELTRLFRKEQATREAQARRIASLEGQLLTRPQPRARPLRPKRPGSPKERAHQQRAAQLRRLTKPKARKTTTARKSPSHRARRRTK